LERAAVGKGQPRRWLLRGREVWNSLPERTEDRLSEAQSFNRAPTRYNRQALRANRPIELAETCRAVGKEHKTEDREGRVKGISRDIQGLTIHHHSLYVTDALRVCFAPKIVDHPGRKIGRQHFRAQSGSGQAENSGARPYIQHALAGSDVGKA